MPLAMGTRSLNSGHTHPSMQSGKQANAIRRKNLQSPFSALPCYRPFSTKDTTSPESRHTSDIQKTLPEQSASGHMDFLLLGFMYTYTPLHLRL
jgi:hypothetical protein